MEFNSYWDEENYLKLKNVVKKYSSDKNKKFVKKIIFTKYEILGVYTNDLKLIAKNISKTDIYSFLDNFSSCDKTYEEIIIYGFVLSYIKNIDVFIKYLDIYKKYVDNWALCDSAIASYKIIKKNKEKMLEVVKSYISEEDEYSVRMGIVMLLDYFISEEYLDIIFDISSNINREEYYIKMAIAWLISICYIKYPKKTYIYLENNNLDKWTHNKAISKIRDSYRVSSIDKEKLNKLKRCD